MEPYPLLAVMIVAAILLSVGFVETPPASEKSVLGASASDELTSSLSTLSDEEWSTSEIIANISRWHDHIEEDHSISISVGDSSLVLNPTGSKNQRNIRFNSAEQAASYSTDHYSFGIADNNGAARLLFGNATVKGFICSDPPEANKVTLHNIMVTNHDSYPEVQLRILSRENSLGCPASMSSGASTGGGSSYPYNPPDPPKQRDVVPDVHLETSYFDGWSDGLDALIHADDAFLVQEDMWDDYTGNEMQPQYWSTEHWGEENIEPTGSGTYCKQKRIGFTAYIDDRGRDLVPNGVFTLISGDDEMECTGIARIKDWGSLADKPDNVNYGLDRTDEGYYGKSNSEHLGVLIAQEIGHNWGHKGHECETVGGEYSAMADSGDCEAPWDDRKFWLHYEDSNKPADAEDSAGRVIDGTQDYDDDESQTGIM